MVRTLRSLALPLALCAVRAQAFGHVVNVVIGSSLSENTKCVTPPGPVACPKNLELKDRTGQYPDEFHIYHHGGQVCARRTDDDGGWGINLVVRCHRTSDNPLDYATSAGRIVFGSNLDSATKCIDAPARVHCDNTAQQLGRTGEYPDTFHIYHQGDQICAKRTDVDKGWGLHLEIQCKIGGEMGGGIGGGSTSNGTGEVVIGTSPDSEVKCVDAPPGVFCDDTAEQVGRTGEWPDTFHIYHEDQRICARRTDHPAGWGLNLVLKCSTYAPHEHLFFRTMKIRWCCTNKPFSPACPFDCSDLASKPSWKWSTKQRQWCCRNRGLGCSSHERPPPAQHGGSGPFNCEVPESSSEHWALPDQQGGGGWHPNSPSHPRYHCTHGSREMWSQDKAKYCRLWLASSAGTAGTGQSGGDVEAFPDHGHKCDVDKASEWDPAEREYCCILKGKGCPKVSAFHPDFHQQHGHHTDRNGWEDLASLDDIDEAPTKPGPGEVSHELKFDCLEKSGPPWSATKQRWCCDKWGLGCQDLGEFNCSSGFWNWQKGWSGEKKDWCCKKEKKGCESEKYDCTKETEAHGQHAREWCCENHLYSRACPFECHDGLDKWITGFSPAKKAWCCRYERLACPAHPQPHPHPHPHPLPLSHPHLRYHKHHMEYEDHKDHQASYPKPDNIIGHKLHSPGAGKHYTFASCQNEADRPQDCVDWCCRMLGLCHLRVSFNCKVGLGKWHRWSPDKKDTCCGKQVRCPKTQHRFVDDREHVEYDGAYHHFGGGAGAPWSLGRDVENLHIGKSPNSGTKCVTPSKPVMCPEDAGNERSDDYPDRFRVYRKGGQLCVQRLDYTHLWGLDLVLKCIKMDSERFVKVQIGSSLDASAKCVPETEPVSCDGDAAKAGRTDPHPDTFDIYHSHGKICAKRTDADSHWGVDLVLYCRKGRWNSHYWSSGVRHLEDGFSEDLKDLNDRTPLEHASWKTLAILPGFMAILLGALCYSASWKTSRATSLLLETELEDANSSRRTARTPWVRIPDGDEGDAEDVA